MSIRIALGNNSVGKRKPINRRGRANENEATAGSVSTRDNSCRYANDGECDEPTYCSTGTDTSDCAAVAAGSCDKRAFASCAGIGEDSYVSNCCQDSCSESGYTGCYFCPAGGTGGPQCFENIDPSTEQSCLSSSNCVGVATGYSAAGSSPAPPPPPPLLLPPPPPSSSTSSGGDSGSGTHTLSLPPSPSSSLSLPFWISLGPRIRPDTEHPHITCRLRRCARLWQD